MQITLIHIFQALFFEQNLFTKTLHKGLLPTFAASCGTYGKFNDGTLEVHPLSYEQISAGFAGRPAAQR